MQSDPTLDRFTITLPTPWKETNNYMLILSLMNAILVNVFSNGIGLWVYKSISNLASPKAGGSKKSSLDREFIPSSTRITRDLDLVPNLRDMVHTF